MTLPRSRGQRAGLTRERLLAAARDLLLEHGAEALTMRALAARLDVRPNALYSHVSNKTGLVDELLDDALADVSVGWQPNPRDGLHDLMMRTYDALLSRAELLPLYLARHGARGAHAQRLGNIVLTLLAQAGVTGMRAEQALHVLVVHTIGSAAFATRSPLVTDNGTDRHREHFDQGLRWLLDGITTIDHPSH